MSHIIWLIFCYRAHSQKTNLVALALADVDFRGEDDALWPDQARHFRAPQQRLLEQWVPLLREELIEQLGTYKYLMQSPINMRMCQIIGGIFPLRIASNF